MPITKNQSKIPQMFRKAKKLPENCEYLQKEIQELEQELRQRKDDLFQLQKENYKCKSTTSKQKTDQFVRPEQIILCNDIDKLNRVLKLISTISGIEVKSYKAEEHCSIVFHMQNDSEHELKHGLRIEMQSGTNVVSNSSLPLGFNIKAVTSVYDNIMMPECLNSIHGALVSYYNRLEQFKKLKRMLKMEADLFKILDGSHIEIGFTARSDMDSDGEDIELVLMLDYRVNETRPKKYSFKKLDLPESAILALREQCLVFKQRPLDKAFKEAFITGIGPYKLVPRTDAVETEVVRKRKLFPPNKHNYNNDDTFHPEYCSDESEDDDEMV